MRSTIQFILRFRNLLLFLGLQVVAFIMLFRTQGFHQTVYMSATGDVVGAIQERRESVRTYLHLRESNEVLLSQIQALQQQLDASQRVPIDSLLEYADTLTKVQYGYTAARVVNLRTNRRNNLMTINKGSEHGITTSMGVVAGPGIAGVVKDVSDHYALVLPVINAEFRTSVRLKRNGTVGSLFWEGGDPSMAMVTDFPRHASPQVGDTLVTTSYSGYFPQDFLVGTVTDQPTKDDGNFLSFQIKLVTDFARLEFVQVVENRFGEERIRLESQIPIE